MRRLSLLIALLPVPALAHPGHVLAESGHDHVGLPLALALAAVALIGLVALLRRT